MALINSSLKRLRKGGGDRCRKQASDPIPRWNKERDVWTDCSVRRARGQEITMAWQKSANNKHAGGREGEKKRKKKGKYLFHGVRAERKKLFVRLYARAWRKGCFQRTNRTGNIDEKRTIVLATRIIFDI